MKTHFKNNGKKGGRPVQDSNLRIKLPDVHLVILTPKQYHSLVEKYGIKIIENAVKILDKWLLSGSPGAKKYIGRNNYGHFRSDGWLINEANKAAEKP